MDVFAGLTVLEKAITPFAIALLPIVWAATTWLFQRWQFRNLILREIQEVGPLPPGKVEARKQPGKDLPWTDYHPWSDHHPPTEKFIHCAILANPTENRDFILSLPPSLVYSTNQLWQSLDNADQWLFMLRKIREEVPWWRTRQKRDLGCVIIS